MTTTPAARDEREAFEKDDRFRGMDFRRVEDAPDHYESPYANGAWDGWRRKAALAESELAEVREQNRILRLGVKGDFDLDAWLEWAKEAEKLRAELGARRLKTCAVLKQRNDLRVELADVLEHRAVDTERLRNQAQTIAVLQEQIRTSAGMSTLVTRERDELRAELERVKADARRYHWLRDSSESFHPFYLSTPIWFTGVQFKPENVDNSIDAAIGAGEGEAG